MPRKSQNRAYKKQRQIDELMAEGDQGGSTDSRASLRKFNAVADRKGRLQFASAASVEPLGYTEDDLLRKPFWESRLFSQSPKSQKAIKDSILAALQGESTECQVQAFTSDGESLPVTFNIGPLTGTDGDIVGITAQTETLGAIDEVVTTEEIRSPGPSQEDLDIILDLLQEGYLESDSLDELTQANASAARLLGFHSPEDLIGQRTADLWADLEERDRFLVELSRKSQVRAFRASLEGREGTEIPIELNAQIRTDSRGEIVGSRYVFSEITAPATTQQPTQAEQEERLIPEDDLPPFDSKERLGPVSETIAEEALRESETKWRLLMENASDIIMTVDRDGTILAINRGITPKTTPEAMIGQTLYDYTSSNYHSTVRRTLQDVFAAGQPRSYESLGTGEEGPDTAWYNTRVARMEKDMAILVSANVSERKRAEAELAAYQQKLQDALKKLQVSYEEISTPVIQVWEHVLAIPLIGVMDSNRAKTATDMLLSKIAESRAHVVILDVTGVADMDTQVTNHLLQTATSTALLGAECVITGIRPEVAQSMIQIGADMTMLNTRRDLQEGLRYALSKMGINFEEEEEEAPLI
jgi:PAS domain S-box-containing protein